MKFNMNYKTFILIFLFLAAHSCSETREDNASQATVLNLEKALDNAENISLSRYASSIRYIPLQTTDSSVIGKILNLCHNDDGISAVSGFKNDIDNGINFTPSFFTGGKMYQAVEADLFMEYAKASGSHQMKRIAEQISEDSNPVLIEVTF